MGRGHADWPRVGSPFSALLQPLSIRGRRRTSHSVGLILIGNVLCAQCHQVKTEREEKGRVKAATCVDHIKPAKPDGPMFWEPSNHQALCAYHHSVKTAAEDGGFGNKINSNIRADCGIDGLPTDERHHWNKC